MNLSKPATLPLAAVIAGLALTVTSIDAAVVTTGVFSTTQFTYAGNVSSSDLLNGLTPIITGWNTTNEAHPNELTDGIHGVGFGEVSGDRVQGGWTTVGATAEYNLGTGANGLGFDLTSIQSIADWVNVGFGNQVWTIDLRPVGGSYSTLTAVDYQPLGGGIGTTQVTLTDNTGLLATGIDGIRITVGAQSGHASGAFVWRELDVFGTDTVPVPEPSAVALLTLGGLALLRRRRRS